MDFVTRPDELADYRKFPVTTVNNYIATFLEDQGIMDRYIRTKFSDRRPTIVPGGQTPELNDAIKVPNDADRAPAYIVYGHELDQHDNLHFQHCERMGYVVFSPNAGKVMEVLQAFRDLFGQADVSAQRVNAWSASLSVPAIPEIPGTPEIPAIPPIKYVPAVDTVDGIEIPYQKGIPKVPAVPTIPEVPARVGKYFHFFDFEYEIVAGAAPMQDDAGRYGGMVNLHYKYNYTLDDCTGLRDSTFFPK